MKLRPKLSNVYVVRDPRNGVMHPLTSLQWGEPATAPPDRENDSIPLTNIINRLINIYLKGHSGHKIFGLFC